MRLRTYHEKLFFYLSFIDKKFRKGFRVGFRKGYEFAKLEQKNETVV